MIIKPNLFQKSAISLLFLLVLLALSLSFIYNQREVIFAHQETVCHPRPIPTGQAIDSTQKAGEQILTNLNTILSETQNQIAEAQTMTTLANECHRIEGKHNIVKCRTGCEKKRRHPAIEWKCDLPETDVHETTYTSLKACEEACIAKKNGEKIKGVCRESDWTTTYHCDIIPCYGDACDFSGINEAQRQIEDSFNKITDSLKNINEIIRDELPPIIELINTARENLEYCADHFIDLIKLEEDWVKPIWYVLSCQLARDSDPAVRCVSADFFCCKSPPPRH